MGLQANSTACGLACRPVDFIYLPSLLQDFPSQAPLLTVDHRRLVNVAKEEIDERQSGKSPMPEDVMKALSKRELRDLVEFLAGLK